MQVRDDSTGRDQGLLQLSERQQNGATEHSRRNGTSHDEPTELPSPLANTESIITQVSWLDCKYHEHDYWPAENRHLHHAEALSNHELLRMQTPSQSCRSLPCLEANGVLILMDTSCR